MAAILHKTIWAGLLVLSCSVSWGQISLVHTIRGGITPKSVVYNGHGKFFAQNMIYMHTVTVYNERYELEGTIRDRVNLASYGHEGGSVKGGPVEVAFSHGGQYAWVSNYIMEGEGFENPGCDNCAGKGFDKGYLYKINTTTLEIEKVIEAGSVPKFVAVSPDDRYVLVSNWTSGDITVISTENDRAIKTIPAGRHPRGIVVDPDSRFAYVTIMGSNKLMKIDLTDFTANWILDVGRAPRHLCIDPQNEYLYCTINNLGKIVKIDLGTERIVAECATGGAPRSMVLTPDGTHLYAVNYRSNTFSKVRCSDMVELEEVATREHPIGITLNPENAEIWVACYSGYIEVFHDNSAPAAPLIPDPPDLLASVDDNASFLMEPYDQPDVPVVEEVEEPKEPETLEENNFLPGTYIVVGSFQNQQNAINLAKDLKSKGFEAQTMPSQKAGFTYTAVPVKSNPTDELSAMKRKVIASAWIYRP